MRALTFGSVKKCLSLHDNTTPTHCNKITMKTDRICNNSVIVTPTIVTVSHVYCLVDPIVFAGGYRLQSHMKDNERTRFSGQMPK